MGIQMFWRRNLIEGNHFEDKGYTGKNINVNLKYTVSQNMETADLDQNYV